LLGPASLAQESRYQRWLRVLIQRGIPEDAAQRYARLFDEEELDLSQLHSLNERILTTVGMTPDHARRLLHPER